MAFHPFHYFRKHQKAIFAVLTIICMFVFILQFGAGDIFSSKRNSRGRLKGDPVLSLYGRTIYTSDLAELAERRAFANQFMLSALRGVVDPSQELDKPSANINESVSMRFTFLRRDLNQAQSSMRGPEDFKNFIQKLSRYITDLTTDRVRGTDFAGTEYNQETKKAIDKEIGSLRARYALLNAELMQRASNFPQFYFGGYQGSTTDLLDFKVWLQQADRLGIQLTEADVIKAVNFEAGNQALFPGNTFALSDKVTWPLISARRDLMDNSFFSRPEADRQQILKNALKELASALTDEFRVLLAKAALLGQSGGVRGFNRPISPALAASPAAVTPDEFYDVLGKKKSSVLVTLAEIPVEDFLPAVKKTPTDAELEKLFNAFRAKPYEPYSREPGFRIPRKIKVDSVTLKADSPYFKKQVEQRLVEGSLQQYLAPLSFPALGGVAGPVLAFTYAENQDRLSPAFLGEEQRESEFNLLDQPYREAHVYRIGTMTFGLGNALGAALSPPPGVAAYPLLAANFATTAAIYQNAERQTITQELLPHATSLLMAPADPVGPLVLAASVAGIKTPPIRILDREITYPSRLKQVQEREGQEQMTRIINEFKEELNKVKGSSTEAAKAVNKFVKTYGLEKEFHAMKTPAGMFEIEKSPELKDLLKAFNDDPKTIYQPGTSKMVRELFSTMPSGTYTIDSRTTGTNGEDRIVFWRSEDERDREPKGLDEVRDQVVAAWKVILARDLARAEANALSKRIAEKAKQLDPKIVAKELADTTYGPEKKKIHPFDLKGSVQEGLVGTELTPLERSAANRTLVPIDKIAYPPSSFVTDILTLQKPGESKVLHDLPETHYYVTLLQERNNKTINDMVSEYANAMSPDSFWMESALLPEQRDYNDMVIRELRTIAAPKEVDDQGRYKLPDGISKRIFDSRGETDSE